MVVRSFRFSSLAITAIFAFSSPIAAASTCLEFEAWYRAQARKPAQGAPVVEWSNWQKESWDAAGEVALLVYRRYREGKTSIPPLDSCVADLDSRETLQIRLTGTFFDQSLQELKTPHDSVINRVLVKVKTKLEASHLAPFRLVGHLKEVDLPGGGNAGFHRGTGSIFMNWFRIPANEWLLIFLHELIHGIDGKISEGVAIYSDPATNARIHELAMRDAGVDALTVDEKHQLDRWLIAGMDRGFLAEWRAWTLTFESYREGLSAGLWSRIDWVETILSENSAESTMETFMMKFLSPRFVDPQEGLFSFKVIQERMKFLRVEMLNSTRLPGFGELEEVKVPRTSPPPGSQIPKPERRHSE